MYNLQKYRVFRNMKYVKFEGYLYHYNYYLPGRQQDRHYFAHAIRKKTMYRKDTQGYRPMNGEASPANRIFPPFLRAVKVPDV